MVDAPDVPRSTARALLAPWTGAVRRLRRALLLRRRLLAALLAGLAVLVAARTGQPLTVPGVEVWSAAHDLPSGEVLGRADLSRASYSPGSVPDGVIGSVDDVLGRTLAAPLHRGTPFTDLSVVSASLLSRFPGRSATPVRLADAGVVDLLRVGDTVDVVAADPTGRLGGRVLTTGASVLALLGSSETGQVATAGRLVLLAVLDEDAADVSAAGVAGYLSVTLTH